MNTFIDKLKSQGVLDELKDKWFSEEEPTEHYDISQLEDINGTLKIAVAPDLKPYIYLKNNNPTGYEIDVLGMFAKEYGYDLTFSYLSFEGILPRVIEGRYDIGVGGFTITEERAESVDFTHSHMTIDVVMAIKNIHGETQGNFWTGLRDSFEKTFIREDRYLLILEGIATTILISVCSLIGGTLLGFGLYLLGRSDIKVIKKVVGGVGKVYSRIVEGTPVVVILMILYYVIFGSFRDISGVLVAIIGFTLTFGSFVYQHMIVSVSSVDPGQSEAAYALGYTKNKTFFRIILPQATNVFLPSYCGNAIDLVKATAVVGYIAVTDLTKMGDIIRSNTYEAFFPLITTAVIYFIMTWGLSLILNKLRKSFEHKHRNKDKILKGVIK